MNGTRSASARPLARFLAPFGLAIAIIATNSSVAQAQTAPANATIGNQASATYTDDSNTLRTATSNTVVTTVTQIAALTLTADNNKIANPGSPIYYPHTVTNTGNGTDSYTLTATNAAGDDFDITGLAVYADADGNGVPDSTTPITVSPSLASGASFRFVVAGTVPSTATAGQVSNVTVRATSVFDNTITTTNTDSVTVTNNASIELIKSISSNSGPAGSGPLTYTLTYRNTGNSTATAFTITDNIPANMTYVAASGTWSKAATGLTDAANGDPAAVDGTTINYTATTSGGANSRGVITAVISAVAPQSSGSITFRVNVDSGITPRVINNQATFSYNDGSGTTRNGNSNTVPFTVTQTAGVTLDGDTEPTATQGGTVRFDNLLTNTGNATDTFDITIVGGSSTFPAGTTFKFFKPDGATPLVDTNNNGIPDTGAVAAGGTYTVVLIAQLPTAATGGPYSVNKLATSTNNPAVNDPATDTLTAITGSTVEITNAAGAGAGPITASPVTTLAGAPGTTQRFELNVQNTSTIADSYTLQFSNTAVFSPAVALPAGFTVTFRNAAGAVITSTGTLAPSATRQLFADVFIPSNASAGNVDIYFRAVSPTSGASDAKFDRVTVNNVRALTVEPNAFGQVFPGGTIVYPHAITNNGNIAETNIALTLTNSATGFTAVVYLDADNDGVLSAAEAATPLTNIANLPAGATVNVLVKVFAPANANPNTVNVTTLTGTAASGQTDNATDTTTVVSGDLKIEKFQAVDADGPGAGAFGAYTKAGQSARPGAYIRYRIVVTNTGSVPVRGVNVFDTTPGYTRYVIAAGTATVSVNGGAATPLSPALANNYVGAITFPVGDLAPGGSAEIIFGVQINP